MKRVINSGFSSLTHRLIFWFGLLVLVPMLISTLAIDLISSNLLREKTLQNMTMTVKARADALEAYGFERTQNANMLGHHRSIAEAVAVLQSPGSSSSALANARQTLNDRSDLYLRYMGLFEPIFISTDGTILHQTSDYLQLGENLLTGPQKNTPLAMVAKSTLTLLEPDISDIARYPGAETPLVFVAAPIFNGNGQTAGLIILQMNTHEIYRILGDYTGLGKTGDIVAAAAQGKNIHLVAPMRKIPDAAFRLGVEIGQDYGQGAQHAVSGDQGYGEVTSITRMPVYASWNYVPSFRWGLIAQQSVDEAMAMIEKQREGMFIVLVAVLIPVLFLALTVAKTISRPIHTAVEAAEQVALGDLTGELSTQAKDETGKLITALGRMVGHLNSLIGQVQRSTIDLVSTANSLGAMTKAQSEEVNILGSTTTEIAAATKQISATAEELLNTMSAISEAADHSSDLATHGQASIGDMENSIRSLAEASHSISTRLSLIHQKANTISNVTTTITRIADQTNLLSLNASIEAEKAGEYGLGFAVLAREIRGLADQTAVATLDIDQMVKEMQDSVSGGVMEMDKFAEQVSRSVADTTAISHNFGEIIRQIQSLSPQFDAVHEGMQSQSAGAKEIRDSMVLLTESVRVSVQALEETTSATHRLESAIDELRSEISLFKLQ